MTDFDPKETSAGLKFRVPVDRVCKAAPEPTSGSRFGGAQVIMRSAVAHSRGILQGAFPGHGIRRPESQQTLDDLAP